MIIRTQAVLAFAFATAMSQAITLLPGGRVGRNTVDAPGSLTIFADAGTMIDMTTQSFSNASTNGTVISSVYRNTNGLLDFAFQVSLSDTSNAVHRVTLYNFGNYSTDVGYLTTPNAPFPQIGTVLASEANRSIDGSVVGWDYDSGAAGLNTGTTTFAMIVRTDATSYQAGNVGVIDGITSNVSGFAPVPEPASFAALGLGAIGLLRRRTNK